MATRPKPKPLDDAQAATEDPRALPTTGIDYAADAGAGLEGTDRDSFAIPFLTVLQPTSPQLETIEGAKAGGLINTVTNTLYADGVTIIPCSFQRRWVRWGARDSGGGYKGDFTPSAANDLRASGAVKEMENRLYFPEQDGSINPKKSDLLSDTRNHYVLIADEGRAVGMPAVFALTSTMIRVSKNFLSRIESQKITAGERVLTAPAFAFMYRVTTLKRTNEKGTWYVPVIESVGATPPGLYAQARAFHAQVMAGAVTVAHETATPEEGVTPAGDGF